MHLLGELANAVSIRLEDLLKDLDEADKERQAFIDDTRQYFEQRLSIYEKKRYELENYVTSLVEQMHELCDKLQLPRITFDNNQMTLIEKRKCINEKIDELKNMILERDKKLIELRQLIDIKAKLTGNIYINIEEITSTDEANSILSELTIQLNTLKQDIRILLDKIRALNSDTVSNNIVLANSFLCVNDENQSLWIAQHQSISGKLIYSRLMTEYENLRELLLAEVLRLRKELDQNEPSPPCDLQQELANLRLRQRYLALLSDFPHKLTSRSTLDEIRQAYEHLTASLRAQTREKLKRLWDQLDVPNDRRIIPKTQDNEDDYLAMTGEINQLEKYIESIRPILTKIQKREWYKKEMIEFEKHAADPARLRGSSTQLLKEERFRKDLSREFPKLTDDLRLMVAEWEESSGKKLIYGGESYLQTMNQEKLNVDFELLHLRLLTKCHVLVQHTVDDTISITSSIQSPPSTPLLSSSTSSSPSSIHKIPTSRIPTMSFRNSNRKLNRHT